MTFAAELDDSRPQLRRGYAGNIVSHWPKVQGANVLATSPSASWYRPDGTSIGSLSVTSTTIDGVSRFRVTLDASSLDLGEGYALFLQ